MSVQVLSALGAGDLSDDERRALRDARPASANELDAWLRLVVGVRVPRVALAPGSSPPFAYLEHAFLEPEEAARGEVSQRDCVVWACRGGGKTFLGATATMLDLVFKPGIEVLILGGSLEQSQRMHGHLRWLFRKSPLAALVVKLTERKVELVNGSCARVLAQSQTSVRGARPQKLRCDEVELFDSRVWEAAQLVTRSKRCGDVFAHGAIEVFSTMHEPAGLMARIAADERRRLFRWGIVDVLEKCAPARACEPCPLVAECDGRAKVARGHVGIDDAIRMKSRASEGAWAAEMLCERPRMDQLVYPEFDEGAHVADFDVGEVEREGWRFVGGMDFGIAGETVVLWAGVGTDGTLRIVDERSVSGARLGEHIEAIQGARWPGMEWIGVDPAGRQRSHQTGISAVTAMRRAGLSVRDRRVGVVEGIEMVRARLNPAVGGAQLVIHARCARLIEALSKYRWADDARGAPLKDGADHAADALRYLIVNLDSAAREARVVSYF